MADKTKIEWTDATWNPITGCTVVSEGCRNCYAMTLAGTRLAHLPSRAGLTRKTADGRHVWTGEVRFNEKALTDPLRWKRPRMIFVCAHGDLFAEGVLDEWIDRVFVVMALAPQHTFQVLTKRPERMRWYLRCRPATGLAGPSWAFPLPNVWLGVSVEDQASADARVPVLLDTPAAVRWVSAEPLLSEVDFTRIGNSVSDEELISQFNGFVWNALTGHKNHGIPRLDWVVVGGESGARARPMHPDWARSIRNQCAVAGVPFFMKQMGGTTKPHPPIPDDLLVREYPPLIERD